MNLITVSMLLTNAIQFAARAHLGQVRKGTETPYIVHPFAVGMILARLGFPDQVIAAGLLHDTLEDTGVTRTQLAEAFGDEIASIVVACSEPDKSLGWRERKQHTIDTLESAPWTVKAVAAADKLDNLRAMRPISPKSARCSGSALGGDGTNRNGTTARFSKP